MMDFINFLVYWFLIPPSWLVSLIDPLWQSPTSKVFVLTAVGAFIGYLIYAGYLSWFIPGAGSIVTSLADFTVVDILTLLPVVLVTLVDLSWKLFKELFRRVTIVSIPTALATLLGFSISLQIKISEGVPILGVFCILGTILWIIGVGGLFTVFAPGSRKEHRRTALRAFFLIFVGAFLSAQLPGETAGGVGEETVMIVRQVLATLMYLLFLPIILFVLGRESAAFSTRERFLSEVSQVVLKQPVQGLGTIEPKKDELPEAAQRWRTTWFKRVTIPVEIVPDVYVCHPEECLYFVTAFRDSTLFYSMPEEPAQTKKSTDKNTWQIVREHLVTFFRLGSSKSVSEKGHAILITNDLIHQITFVNKQEVDEGERNADAP